MSETQEIDSVIIERRHIHKRDGSVQIIELIDAEVARKLQHERDEARAELEEYRSIAENIGATKAVSDRDKAVAERDEAREQNAKLQSIAERILLNCETLHPNTVKLHRAELDQLKEGVK
jgi:hypothetical protein